MHPSGIEGKFGAEAVSRIDRLLIEPTIYEGFRLCLRISTYVLNKTVQDISYTQLYSTQTIQNIIYILGRDFNDVLNHSPQNSPIPIQKNHCSSSKKISCEASTTNLSESCISRKSSNQKFTNAKDKIQLDINIIQDNSTDNYKQYESFYKSNSDFKIRKKSIDSDTNQSAFRPDDHSNQYNQQHVLNSYNKLNHGMYNMSISQTFQDPLNDEKNVIGGSGKYEETKSSTKEEDGTVNHNHEIVHEKGRTTRGQYGNQYHNISHKTRNNFTQNEQRKYFNKTQDSEVVDVFSGVKAGCNGEKVRINQNNREYNRLNKTADDRNGVYSSVQHRTKTSIENESPLNSNQPCFNGQAYHGINTFESNLGIQPQLFSMKPRDFRSEFGFLSKSSPFKSSFGPSSPDSKF
ncbi:hypothetical protein BB561_001300 [Smittium simulii]|uniref:Uncharacterized protein n=1 Tax=Smittium simulii TaxID=133385 RepID=A0A2T9YV70_9FUNG|nr:hypothetical protein BB561_001300 [Smittium simulii]